MLTRLGQVLTKGEWARLVMAVLIVLAIPILILSGGCATRVEVDEPGDWDSIYIGKVNVVNGGVTYQVKLYKTYVVEEDSTVYIALSTASQGMGVAVVPQ